MTTISTTRPPTDSAAAAIPGRTGLLALWVDGVAVFGLAIVLVPWVRNEAFNWVAYGATGERFDPAAREYLEFVFCISGALTVALAVGLWFLVRHPLRHGEVWAWHAVLATVGTWFVIDSIASVATGFGRNAVLNLVLLLAAVPGIVASRPR